MPTRISQDDFINAWQKYQSPSLVARALNMSERAVQSRRADLRAKGHDLHTTPIDGNWNRVPAYNKPEEWQSLGWTFAPFKELSIDTGTVVVSSDHHYWPRQNPLAHRALLKVIKMVKPRVKVLNGDVFDGGSISRHPPFGWSQRPSPVDELHACQERVNEIVQALPRGCERVWPIGNHDIRFERTLASKVPEFANLRGMRLSDHFDGWDMVHALWINRSTVNPTLCVHNIANGVHSGYSGTAKAGVTTVTGHTHALEVKPFVDMRGRRYGCQTGTIADLDGPQFEYHAGRPSQACSGFIVLTFADSHLLQPEICQVVDGKAWFRGEVVAKNE